MKLKKGTKIAYAAAFLESICEDATGELWTYRGHIVDFDVYCDFTLATVFWSDGTEGKVNVKNLAIVGPNLRFNRR